MPWNLSRRSASAAILAGLSAIGLAVGLLVSAPAAADPQERSTSAPPLAVIIDGSGSMTAADAGGQSRIDAAKQATRGLIESLPEEQEVSLLTYGTGTGSSAAEKEAGCRDITVLEPLGRGTRERLLASVDTLAASGYTPIGKALLMAEEQLPAEGPRQVVLVSDGIDTCAPPPVCEVAQQMKERGTDLVINTIGFNVDPQARAELECVARATEGSYADVRDAASLQTELVRKSGRSLIGAEVDGERITGSRDPGAGPVLDVGGVDDGLANPMFYRDVMPASEDDPTLHYTVELEEGDRLHIGLLVPPPPAVGIDVGATWVVRPELRPVGEQASCSAWSGAVSYANSFSTPIGGSLVSEIIGESERCPAGRYEFVLEQAMGPGDTPDLPFRMGVWVDNGTDDSGLPPSSEEPAFVPLPTAEPSAPANAATSPADAEVITEGSAVTAEIVAGETHWFRVPVHDGQRLRATIQLTDNQAPQADSGRVDEMGRRLGIAAFSPAMMPLELVQDGERSPSGLEIPNDGTVPQTPAAVASAPVRWANLEAPGDLQSAYLAGEQLVAVRYDALFAHADATTEQFPVTYTFTADAFGDPEQGPSLNGPTAQAPDSDDEQVDDEQAAAAPQEDADGLPAWAWALMATALVAAVTVVAVLLALRRRRTSANGVDR
ncbi:VWA domain-containing protein [uncultured Aeromicrobium sp.]|uniref:vWA domain-containing protein n=1 Tax=uncultured Aeromicrobium sp. TaxID=337820 RepID=UPI0025DDF11D|nr:VWA domain-containing protein [uncultured Aeromicrobium sp.]